MVDYSSNDAAPSTNHHPSQARNGASGAASDAPIEGDEQPPIPYQSSSPLYLTTNESTHPPTLGHTKSEPHLPISRGGVLTPSARSSIDRRENSASIPPPADLTRIAEKVSDEQVPTLATLDKGAADNTPSSSGAAEEKAAWVDEPASILVQEAETPNPDQIGRTQSKRRHHRRARGSVRSRASVGGNNEVAGEQAIGEATNVARRRPARANTDPFGGKRPHLSRAADSAMPTHQHRHAGRTTAFDLERHMPNGHRVGANGNGWSSVPAFGTRTPGEPEKTIALDPEFYKDLMVPAKKLKPAPTWTTSMRNIVFYSWLNLFLVFIPISWAAHFAGLSDVLIFTFSCLAIVPLAALLGLATEELALRVGDTFGGLLNATFGNAVELIIAILALVKGELRIVQSAMIGGLLSNCLLVLGCCFLVGGLRFHEQAYAIPAAQTQISLLGMAVLAIVIPAAFHAAISDTPLSMGGSGQTTQQQAGESDQEVSDHILRLSRGTAFLLLITYVAFLVFQLWTHAYRYQRRDAPNPRRLAPPPIEGEPAPPEGQRVFPVEQIFHHSGRSRSGSSSSSSSSSGESEAEGGAGGRTRRRHRISRVISRVRDMTKDSNTNSQSTGTSSSSSSSSSSASTVSEEEEEEPKLKAAAAWVLIVVITVITGFTAEWLVDSIDGLTATGAISREFVGIVLLPLVGNAAEHVTAVTVAYKNKLDLSISVAIGSSIQIALFVLPFLILLGWGIGQDLTLFFDVFETVTLFVAIIVVNWCIADGRSNWFEGFVLIIVYVIVALSFWYYPGSEDANRRT